MTFKEYVWFFKTSWSYTGGIKNLKSFIIGLPLATWRYRKSMILDSLDRYQGNPESDMQ
jgi:hypothetical protein